jgi:hypothetical protein
VSCEPASGGRARVFGVVQGAYRTLELPDHLREIVDIRRDQGVDIDVPVAVDDPSAQTRCRALRDLRVGVLRLDRDLAGGLPENSEVPQQR